MLASEAMARSKDRASDAEGPEPAERGAHCIAGNTSRVADLRRGMSCRGARFAAQASGPRTAPPTPALSVPDNEEEGRAVRRTHRGDLLVARPFWVFNVAQIDRLPSELAQCCSDAMSTSPHGPIERACP